jgi:hypothetical protein
VVKPPEHVPLVGRDAATGDEAPAVGFGVCRIYTPEGGFFVFVDGERAVDRAGEPVRTPCLVHLREGDHEIVVAQTGWYDRSTRVTVSRETPAELDLQPEKDVLGEKAGLLDAPWFALPVGQPVPLASLNSRSAEQDPFVTADGLTIWFFSDRPEGKGIWYAARRSRFHAFDEPVLMRPTRGLEALGSPCITGDGLFLAYAVPDKARVWGLRRENPLQEFSDRVALAHSRADTSEWPVVQLLADGRTLYWRETDGSRAKVFETRRKETTAEFPPAREVQLPGGVPCLSHDGLRQYVFDGKTLRRAQRLALDGPFSSLETVAEPNVSTFVRNTRFRQIWVADDEQWLYYAADPVAEPDLFAVRLAPARRFGELVRGGPIPPKEMVAATTTPAGPNPDDELFDPESLKDPRIRPLPYAAHWEAFRKAMGARKYDEAEKLLRRADADGALDEDRQLLAWDRIDLRNVRRFWDDVRAGIGTLKPGDEIRFKSVVLNFQAFEGDVLRTRTKTGNEFLKDFLELDHGDLLPLMDRYVAPNDEQAYLCAGTFLYHEPKAIERQVDLRLEKAGNAGGEFVERIGLRQVQLAKHEIERKNYLPALDLLQKVQTFAPNSDAAFQAELTQDDVYRAAQWRPVGRRKWKTEIDGSWAAEPGRSDGSWLLSAETHGNFELHLEWKTEGTVGEGGGGVWFRFANRSGERPFDQDAAFKIQLSNDYGFAADRQSTGALFGLVEPRRMVVKPTGQWNTLVLRVEGERVRSWINGRIQLDTKAVNPEIPLKGFLALDGLPGGITYRRIVLMDLPDPSYNPPAGATK